MGFQEFYAQVKLESTQRAVFFLPTKIQYKPRVRAERSSVFSQTMKNEPAFPVNLILLPSISALFAHAL